MAKKTPYDKLKILDENHWKGEKLKQRMTVEHWRLILLHNDDSIVFKGRVTRLVAKKLGFGVVEVSKEVLYDNEALAKDLEMMDSATFGVPPGGIKPPVIKKP